MRLVIDNVSEDAMRQMAILAAQHHSTPEEEAAEVINRAFSRASIVETLKQMHAEMLSERGGVPFPDSVELIREMRAHD